MFGNSQKEYANKLIEIYNTISQPITLQEKLSLIEDGLEIINKLNKWPDNIGIPIHRVKAALLFSKAKSSLELAGDKDYIINTSRLDYEEALNLFDQDPPSFNSAMCAMNLSCLYADLYEIEYTEKAIELCTFSKNFFSKNLKEHSIFYVQACANLSAYYQNRLIGDYNANLDYSMNEISSALDILDSKNNLLIWAQIRLQLGGLFLKSKRPHLIKPAIEIVEEVKKIFIGLNLNIDIARSNLILANLFFGSFHYFREQRNENLNKALLYAEDSFECFFEYEMRKEILASLSIISNSKIKLYERGEFFDHDDILEQLQFHLENAKYINDTEEISNAILRFGDYYSLNVDNDPDNINKAISCYKDYCEITKNRYEISYYLGLVKIADSYMDQQIGKYNDNVIEAIRLYKLASNFFKKNRLQQDLIQVDIHLAIAYSEIQGSDYALYNEKAIALLEVTLEYEYIDEQSNYLIYILVNLSSMYLNRSFGNKLNSKNLAYIFSNIAMKYCSLDDDEKLFSIALANFLQSQRVTNLDEENLEYILELLNCTLDKLSSNKKAIEWVRLKREKASFLANLALHQKSLDVINEAIDCCNDVINIISKDAYPRDHAYIQLRLATIFHYKNTIVNQLNSSSQINAINEAIGFFSSDKNSYEYFVSLIRKGRIFSDKGDWKKSDQIFSEAISSLGNNIEKFDEFFSSVLESNGNWDISLLPYSALVNGDIKRAIWLFEILRACSLRQSLSRNIFSDVERSDESKIENFSQWFTKTLDDRDPIEKKIILDYLDNSKNNFKDRNEIKNIDLNDECLASSESWVFIPFFSSNESMAILIPPNGSFSDLIISDTIKLGFNHLIDIIASQEKYNSGWFDGIMSLRSDEVNPFHDSLEYISSYLWNTYGYWIKENIYNDIPAEIPSLVCIPHGFLSLLPLSTASLNQLNTSLLDVCDISYFPSIYALKKIEKTVHKDYLYSNNIALMIKTDDPDLKYLDFESKLILNAFSNKRAFILEGEKLTRKNIFNTINSSKYWHFATHGTYDFYEVGNSNLALAANNKITLDDLLLCDNRYPPRLVSLSACETGIIDVVNRLNEFPGFSETFMKLGACGVIATLWVVSDLVAALFFGKFYHLHIKLGHSPIKALNYTQRWLRKSDKYELIDFMNSIECKDVASKTAIEEAVTAMTYCDDTPVFSHPIFWAAFVLYGR